VTFLYRIGVAFGRAMAAFATAGARDGNRAARRGGAAMLDRALDRHAHP
jgi:hypothetical protein